MLALRRHRGPPRGAGCGPWHAEHSRGQPLNPALRTEKLSLSYDSGVGFDFSVHVLAFER